MIISGVEVVADILRESGVAEDRARPSGLVPPAVTAPEWRRVSRGVRQRVLALEAFLADAYGRGRVFEDGVVPWRLLFTSGQFRREAAGLIPPNGVRLHAASFDLIRAEQGQFRVLADNILTDNILTGGAPSGVSHLTGEYASRLLSALRAAAPHGMAGPRVVLLTAAGHEPAAYAEDALLARRMGVALVEGRDLLCHRNRVCLRTVNGTLPVDVIYRRAGDDWLDPMHFRPESRLGCPGLVNAARAGQVTIANAIGNGVAAGTFIRARVPDLIRYYLGAEPLLGNAEPATDRRDATDRPGAPRRALRVFAVNDGGEVHVPHASERSW